MKNSKRYQTRIGLPGVPMLWTACLTILMIVAPQILDIDATAQDGPDRIMKTRPAPGTRVEALQTLSTVLEQKAAARRTPAYHALRALTDGPMGAINRSPDMELMGLDARGRPLVYATENLIAAQSVGMDHLWPGGSSGLDLTGANTQGDLVVWDAGLVRSTHQEFGGRVVIGDPGSSIHYHSTHVGGTLVGSGVDPDAKGMSPAAILVTRDWNNDEAEMASDAAAGMMLSNHSYGYGAGWSWNSSAEAWYWYGDVDLDPDEDPAFGSYWSYTQDIDQVAYDAPYYLICKSAGNDRDDDGPAPGEGHYYWDNSAGNWAWSTDSRGADGQDGGYDTIPYKGNAKNILTVGAIYDVPGGWTAPGDVVMSSFSGWGPTDDGRIKPDIVANGIGLYSTYSDADDSYASFSGTSMASPNACGALHAVARYYDETHVPRLRSATLKALAVHTADEAGPAPGPDYMNGWGLLNAAAAAEVVRADANGENWRITQSEIFVDITTKTFDFESFGAEPVTATLCWTDPPGPTAPYQVDPTGTRLVNDLDLRIEYLDGGTTHHSWLLDPANPSAAATTGDNDRDNVKKVEIASPLPGAYRVVVEVDGTLDTVQQQFSLVVSGLSEVVDRATLPYLNTFSSQSDLDNWINQTAGAYNINFSRLNWTADRSVVQTLYRPLETHTGDFTCTFQFMMTDKQNNIFMDIGLAETLTGAQNDPADGPVGTFIRFGWMGGGTSYSTYYVTPLARYADQGSYNGGFDYTDPSTYLAFTEDVLYTASLDVVGADWRLTLLHEGDAPQEMTGTFPAGFGGYESIYIGNADDSDWPQANGFIDNLLVTDQVTWPGPSNPPVVENVAFAQRTDGSGLVDIVYDLSDPESPTATVTIEASSDGGATWTLAVTTLTGDVGDGVTMGVGKTAVWDFGADHPGVFLEDVVIRVTADDGS